MKKGVITKKNARWYWFRYTKKDVLEIPETVTKIEAEAFTKVLGKQDLVKKVVIPGSVQLIGEKAFFESHINEVVFLSADKKVIIGNSAFSGSTIVKIELPTVELGSKVFENCSKLQLIEFKGSIKAIPDCCFCGCRNLENIILPNTIESIGDYAFSEIAVMRSINLPKSVKNLGIGIFCNSGMEYVGMDFSLPIVPEAMFRNSHIKNVVLNETYKIDKNAFEKCEYLENVSVYNSNHMTLTIEDRAFRNCESLRTVYTQNDVDYIGYFAFAGCKSLISFDIGVTEIIGEGAFWGAEALRTITYTEKVNEIGEEAFKCCKMLESISFAESDSLRKIGKCAFFGCTSLGGNITFYNGVEVIEEGAFDGCTNLESITFETSKLTKLSRYSFNDCLKLSNIYFSENCCNIKVFAESCFSGCCNLSTVELPKGTAIVGNYAFSKCIVLKNFEFNSEIEEIGEHAFDNCVSLEKMELPHSIRKIGKYAFNMCVGLKEITMGLPAEIGANFVKHCSFLEKITIK